jgi:hypothetical protein
MPYKSKTKQKKAMRTMFKARYRTDEEFRQAEKDRKADWYQRNRERLIAKAIAYKEGK